MRAALDLVLPQPVGVERAQDAQRRHRLAAVEDVVDDALEVVPAAPDSRVNRRALFKKTNGDDFTSNSCRTHINRPFLLGDRAGDESFR